MEMTCPKCHGQSVTPVEVYPRDKPKESSSPLWACKNLNCLHTWPRERQPGN